MEDIDAFLKQQVAQLCGVEADSVHSDGKLIAYGMDSVRLIDLIISVEDAYDMEISEQDPRLAMVKTVNDLVDYIQQRRREG